MTGLAGRRGFQDFREHPGMPRFSFYWSETGDFEMDDIAHYTTEDEAEAPAYIDFSLERVQKVERPLIFELEHRVCETLRLMRIGKRASDPEKP